MFCEECNHGTARAAERVAPLETPDRHRDFSRPDGGWIATSAAADHDHIIDLVHDHFWQRTESSLIASLTPHTDRSRVDSSVPASDARGG